MALSKKPTNTCHGFLTWQGFKPKLYIYIQSFFAYEKNQFNRELAK